MGGRTTSDRSPLAGIKAYSIVGDFVLSDFSAAKRFLDAQALVLDPDYRQDLVAEFRTRLEGIQAVAALAWSPASLLLASEIAREGRIPMFMVELPQYPPVGDIVSEYTIKGPPRLVDGKSDISMGVIGDVCVTGGSLLWACRTLSSYGFRPRPAVILDRERGGAQVLAREGFELKALAFESGVWPTDQHNPARPLDMDAIRDQKSHLDRLYLRPVEIPAVSPRAKMEEWLKANDAVLQDLARQFSGYWRPVAADSVANFLLQLRSPREMGLMLEVLKKIEFYSQENLTAQVVGLIDQIERESGADEILICPWGGPRDSAAVVGYLANKGLSASTFETAQSDPRPGDTHRPADRTTSASVATRRVMTLGEALRRAHSPNRHRVIVFVDDIVQIGTQSASILRQWLGAQEPEGSNSEEMVQELEAAEKTTLRGESQTFLAVPIAFDVGLREAETVARDLGLHLAVRAGRILAEHQGCFSIQENKFPASEIKAVHDLCLDIGRELHADKVHWDDRKRELFALGYGNSQKLIVFSHNTPTATISCLWKPGNVHGTPWDPLFLRR